MTLVVKLGSSVVATDDGELRHEVLDAVCAQVDDLRRRGESIVIVSSGAIARGMRIQGLVERPKGMDELQAASAIGQGDLFHAYQSRLAALGTKTAQVLLARSDISRRSHYRNAQNTITRLLQWGVVPIVNENDTTATVEITFGDNDFLAAQIAVFLRADLLVLLTNTDGLFTADPRETDAASRIAEVWDARELERVEIGRRPSHLGRGGMGSKVAAAEMASQSNVEVVICNGQSERSLLDAASGADVGTKFHAHRPPGGKQSIFKLWLKYATEPTGSVVVDGGAAERLRQSGSSLLPVGIVAWDGHFVAGDVVRVIDATGRELIGHGVTEYSARDLDQIMGRKTPFVREMFPTGPSEVIHRDRFALV